MYEDPILVLVVWYDSYGVSAEWTPITDMKSPLLRCSSVGWLINETEYSLTILPHMTPANHDHAVWQGCGDMTIPRASLVSIHELDKTRELAKTCPADDLCE